MLDVALALCAANSVHFSDDPYRYKCHSYDVYYICVHLLDCHLLKLVDVSSVMNTTPLCYLLLGVALSCSFANGHTIYIRSSAAASCGLSETSGDPCYTWNGSSPTIVPRSTTLVFTSGYYTVRRAIATSSMTNFTMIGEPSARIGCTYRSSYGTAFTLSNISNVSISNLPLSSMTVLEIS